MIRKALIIYGGKTESGPLDASEKDCSLFIEFLTSPLGGSWHKDEIIFLENPSSDWVNTALHSILNKADYTLTLFSGHGHISLFSNKLYLELRDNNVPIQDFKTGAPRQTIIIDSCKGSFNEEGPQPPEFKIEEMDTRKLFDETVMNSSEGLSVLYSTYQNDSALDTPNGSAYLLSLLHSAKQWYHENTNEQAFLLDQAHQEAKKYMETHFDTKQNPSMNSEKWDTHFPLAVKLGN